MRRERLQRFPRRRLPRKPQVSDPGKFGQVSRSCYGGNSKAPSCDTLVVSMCFQLLWWDFLSSRDINEDIVRLSPRFILYWVFENSRDIGGNICRSGLTRICSAGGERWHTSYCANPYKSWSSNGWNWKGNIYIEYRLDWRSFEYHLLCGWVGSMTVLQAHGYHPYVMTYGCAVSDDL